jgi:hypothetical protein
MTFPVELQAGSPIFYFIHDHRYIYESSILEACDGDVFSIWSLGYRIQFRVAPDRISADCIVDDYSELTAFPTRETAEAVIREIIEEELSDAERKVAQLREELQNYKR